jgi:hypothetical protein
MQMSRVIRIVIILTALSAMLAPRPAPAVETNYGTRDWNYTVYSGPNQFVFNRAAAIRLDDFDAWRGRVALKCTRNGQPTNCNLDVDNMTVYEDCTAFGNPLESWGPRDFSTVQGTWYYPFQGAWHPLSEAGHCWYRVKAEASARFLDINIETPWMDVCSYWVQPVSSNRYWTTCDV